jgi:GR25 family glycosyltransferase involved in LPS biosynthesis
VPYSSRLPEYKILSLSRIACWHSHLSVIQRVSTHRPNEVALILEDDVDMEEDITERLSAIWSLLPSNWDIVFLGESYGVRARATLNNLHRALLVE